MPIGLTAVAILLVLAASSHRIPSTLVLFPLALIGLLELGHRWPLALSCAGLAGVVLVPIYYGRNLAGLSLGVTPVALVCISLAPVAWRQRHSYRLVPMDLAFFTYVGLAQVANVLNVDRSRGLVIFQLLTVVLPYMTFRLVALRRGAIVALAWTLVVAAVPLSVLALMERAGLPNPYFTLVRPAFQAGTWARPDMRFATVRAEASFGHPIALGMFLALTFLLCVALAITTRRLSLRVFLLLAMLLMLLAIVATLSRGALLMVALSAPLFALTQLPRLDAPRFRRLASVAIVLLLVGLSAQGTLGALERSSYGDSVVANSARYRVQLIQVALDPANFTLIGKRFIAQTGILPTNLDRFGLVSVDNTYVLLFLTSGLLVLIAFAALGVVVWLMAFSPGMGAVERAWVIATAVAFMNLLTVALLTQYADLFWLSIGVIASAWQLNRRDRLSRSGSAPGGLAPGARVLSL